MAEKLAKLTVPMVRWRCPKHIGNNTINSDCTEFRRHSPAQFTFKQGETDMGEKGKKDKGKREQRKKAQLNPKEKRKLKKEKKK